VISKNITRIRENRQANADLIRKQKERIEKDIRDLREAMNNHLDKLQERLRREFMEVEVKTNNVIQDLLTTLQRQEEEIYQSQINIENIKKYASELQAFLGLKQIQGISMKNETYIQSLVEDDNFKETQLRFKADDQILHLLNNVNSFGKIIIETKSSEVDIVAYKQNQAQQRVVSIPVRSVNDVMLKLKQRITTDRRNVEGRCIMSNGKMVFTILSPGEVIILHKDGSMKFKIDIRSRLPRDVTCIDNTYRSERKLHLTSSKMCSTESSYVTTNGNKMYYTNNTEDTVTCCDVNGKVQWEFHNENVLDSPIGITTDKNNNIYVVGGGSYNVVVISRDGQNYKVLLSDSDGVRVPWGIHCARSSDQLLLTSEGDKAGLLYDITTTPT
jgi:hypothetical protein